MEEEAAMLGTARANHVPDTISWTVHGRLAARRELWSILMFPPHRERAARTLPRATTAEAIGKQPPSHTVRASARPRPKSLGVGVSHGAQQTARGIHRAHRRI